MKFFPLSIPSERPVFQTMLAAGYKGVLHLVWGAAILLLPVTSLPALVEWSGASTVAPPSNVFFLMFAGVWLLPYILIEKARLPLEVVPLLVFLAAAVLAWAASFFIEIPPFRGTGPLSEGLEAFITLAMAGAVFLASAAWLSASPRHMRYTLLLINLGGMLLVAWSLVQAYYVFYNNSQYPRWVVLWQEVLSVRPNPLFYARVTGAAYEPSWLAHQLNMVYLPAWLAATVTGFTAFGRKLWRISVENVLLAAGLFVLMVSFSRVGFLSFLLMLSFLAVKANLRLAWKVHERVSPRLHFNPVLQRLSKTGLLLLLMAILVVLYAGLLAGAVYAGSFFEPRLARIINQPLDLSGFYQLANQLAIAERVIYWAAGWQVFNDFPWLGVGPGNAGFFFPQKMPVFGYALWEVSQLFNYLEHVPNTKSMWVRILAETGLVGFSVFASWFYLLWRSASLASKGIQPLLKTAGLTGQLALIGFLIEGFSIDSFALPYFWFAAGLLSAAAFLVRKAVLERVEN